ncbi:MAG: FtsW/RodA/SpoVE family cell cycle protein, partial [Thiohalobacterales bacterium]|nr:FtsW/RodA/SpoVE family cell cycle protein [Thiohalobacterales bacterium]
MSIAVTPHHEDASRRGWQHRLHLDAQLLFSLIGLSTFGLIVLYSAGGADTDLVERQLVRLAIAFTGMFLVAQVPPRLLFRMTPWVFVIGVLFLLAVLIGGERSGGAQRWLNLYIVRFQPSEIMKLAVPMMVAWYLAEARLPPIRWQLLLATVLIAVPV